MGALERVLPGLADQTSGHDREAQRPRLLADRCSVLGRDERRVVLVREAERGFEGAAAASSADKQRRSWPLDGPRLRGRVLERVVPALEVDALLGPEPVDDLDLLREHLDPRP